MIRVFTLTPKFPPAGSGSEEAVIVLPDTWNAPAILDALAALDLHYEPRGFADVRAEEM